MIDAAIGGEFQAVGWRNHPGADPDTQYVWWYNADRAGSNPVNFGRFNDPEINRLLDEGRTTADEAQRQQIYEDLNKRFAEQLWNIWGVVHDLVDRQSTQRARRARPGTSPTAAARSRVSRPATRCRACGCSN